MNEIEATLVSLGFHPNEIKLYVACLKTGEATATELAQVAHLPRTYCYDLLKALEEKGLASSVIRGKRLRYLAVNPQRIKKIFSQKLHNLEAVLPTLEGLFHQSTGPTKVRYFEGKEGLATIHRESLDEATQIDVFGEDQEWVNAFPNWQEHVRSVVKAKIRVREIAKPLEQTRIYNELYNPERQEMRFSLQEWVFKTNVMMWNNKTVFLTYTGHMHGVIIESESITDTMRAVFEVMWLQAVKE